MLEVFDEFNVPGVLAINGSAIATYPPIAQAAQDRNWEFMGHGFIQKNMQKVENERSTSARPREAIQKFTGKPPRGWLGPGLTETWDTPDLLQEAGLRLRLRLGAGRPAGRAENAQRQDRSSTSRTRRNATTSR